ncbi:uncharacterized protein LOC125215755 isoform X2 [Salvia hispanica]|uniref:uncharacterized protein LOC125215755 isoform X2 n=1 Tax=Salvia hispanica TaxID=49212 RepID=UPI0020094EC4|nr:uncharacterized protein LOC125215755 isoform X2 [Salvia hispanica]
MFQAMATEASYDNPDDWELINDDGFVYKRKKRPRLEPIVAAPPASEQNHRLLRQKRALLKLRDRYLEEISRWELLSNTLTAMEQNASAQLMERHELHPSTSSDGASSSSEPSAADFYRRRLVDDLLSQCKRGNCKAAANRPTDLGSFSTGAHGCISIGAGMGGGVVVQWRIWVFIRSFCALYAGLFLD